MNSKQRRQKFNQLVAAGQLQEANKFLWNTQFSAYCNQQYNHGRDALPEEWFKTLSNHKLEIIANPDNYVGDVNVQLSIIKSAKLELDQRLDTQLGISD